MQTGYKNARAISRLRVPQLHAAAGRLSPGAVAQWSEPVGNGLSRACLSAAPPLSLPSTTAVPLRAGLVAIRSRQRVSERRSPERGELRGLLASKDPSTHAIVAQVQAKTRSTRKHPGCKQSRTDFLQSIGKTLVATIGRTSQLLASPNSQKMGQDFSQNCYGKTDICPDSLSGRHNGFVQSPDHFSEISRIFR